MFLGVYFFANNASMDVGNLLGITRNTITEHVCRRCRVRIRSGVTPLEVLHPALVQVIALDDV